MDYSFENKDGTATLSLSGELTYKSNDCVGEVLNALQEKPAQRMTVNLQNVNFVDSAGLGILLLLRDRSGGIPITLSNPREQVLKILKLTKLDAMFAIA